MKKPPLMKSFWSLALMPILAAVLAAQSFEAQVFSGRHWRSIGPFRGGGGDGNLKTLTGIAADLRKTDLAVLNAALKAAGLAIIEIKETVR
jgi:hypothetical protein